MKKCPKCEKYYPDDAQFCMNCGGELENHEVPPSKAGLIVKGILKTICYVFLMIGLQSAVATVYLMSAALGDPAILGDIMDGTLDSLLLSEKLTEILYANYSMIMLVANLVTVLVLCLFFTLRRKNPAEEMMLRPVKWQVLPMCALYGAALNIFISVTLSFIPFPTVLVEELDTQYEVLYGQTNIIIELLNSAVLTGLVEEIVFRGLAISRLRRGMSRGAAVVVSAVIFGIGHGAIIAVAYATVLGIVFALLANRFDSILPTVVCHIFFNATSYCLTTDNGLVILALYAMAIAVLVIGSYVLFKKDSPEEAHINE